MGEYVVSKEITVSGQNYTIVARLTEKGQQFLYCSFCRDLSERYALQCAECHNTICKTHRDNAPSGSSLLDKCPNCREPYLEEKDLIHDLNRLLWECPKCPEEFTLANMHSHLLMCGITFNCDFASHGCEVTGNYDQVAAHEKECSYRPEECPFEGCTGTYLSRDKYSHAAQCPHALIQIPGTSIEGPRYQIEPVNAVISTLSQPGQEQQSDEALEQFRNGFFGLLELTKKMVENLPTREPEMAECPQCLQSVCDQNSHQLVCKKRMITCPECSQPFEAGDMDTHECGIYTCSVCKLRQPYSGREFHNKYCHSVFDFIGRRLTLYVRDSTDQNAFITYQSGDDTVYFIVPPGNIHLDMAPVVAKFLIHTAQLQLTVHINADNLACKLADFGLVSAPHFRLVVQGLGGNTLYCKNGQCNFNKSIILPTRLINWNQNQPVIISVHLELD